MTTTPATEPHADDRDDAESVRIEWVIQTRRGEGKWRQRSAVDDRSEAERWAKVMLATVPDREIRIVRRESRCYIETALTP